MKLRGIPLILALLLAFMAGIKHVRAQTLAPWQAAEQVRSALFGAQGALLADDTTLASAQVQAAQDAFTTTFAAPFDEAAPSAYQDAQAGLALAETAARDADADALALARGAVWGALLEGSYQLTLHAVEGNQPDAAQAWLRVREFRQSTRFSRPGADATLAVESLRAGTATPEVVAEAVRADLLDTYQSQMNATLDALESAAQQELGLRQAEAAGLAQGYWLILAPAYESQASAAEREQATALFAALPDAAQSGDTTTLAAAIESARTTLNSFRAAPLSEEEQARRAGQLLRYLSLVPIEYRRGIRNGEVALDIEIQEALTFLDGAQAAFDDLHLTLDALDSSATSEIAAHLEQANTHIQAASRHEVVVPPDTIDTEIRAATDSLKTLLPAEWQTNADSDLDVVAAVLDQMEMAVTSGQYQQAESARLEAYAIFDLGLEPRLLAFRPDLVERIDGLFWQGHGGQIGLSQAIAGRATKEEVEETRAILNTALLEAQRALGDGSSAPAAIITNAGVIVFREGLEAVVILAALMASLVGPYHHFRRPIVYGVVLALVATALSWVGAQRILANFVHYGERLEAVMSIIAIGVLLLITNWFFHKSYWNDWISGFHQRKRQLISGEAGQFLGLLTLGFTSVYREGFETVLFLQALVLDAGPSVVLQGVALGMLGVVVVGVLTFKLQTKLPYKRMLVVTGVLIGAVLLTLVGGTLHVMQAVSWMSITPLRGVELPYWMGLWFGVFPTWETLGGQAAAAVFVIGSYLLAERSRKGKMANPSRLPLGRAAEPS